jgi:hypothetical protein
VRRKYWLGLFYSAQFRVSKSSQLKFNEFQLGTLINQEIAMKLRLRPEVADLVLECVHPSHFKALPPSPEDIANEASFIGLASYWECFLEWWEQWGWYPTPLGTEWVSRGRWVPADK